VNSQSADNRNFIFVEHSHSAIQKYIGNILILSRRQYQPHRTSLEHIESDWSIMLASYTQHTYV